MPLQIVRMAQRISNVVWTAPPIPKQRSINKKKTTEIKRHLMHARCGAHKLSRYVYFNFRPIFLHRSIFGALRVSESFAHRCIGAQCIFSLITRNAICCTISFIGINPNCNLCVFVAVLTAAHHKTCLCECSWFICCPNMGQASRRLSRSTQTMAVNWNE